MLSESAAVILAAGKGTRLKSERPKVLHQAGGLPLVVHVVRALRNLNRPPARRRARRSRGLPLWVVVGHRADSVRAVVEPLGAATVLQKPQLGTGHAVAQALLVLPQRVRRLLVLPGDAPLIRPETLSALLQSHAESGSAVTVLTARLDDPHGYGRIVRDSSGAVEAIVEQKSLRPEESSLHEVNSGIYCVERKALAPLLGRLGRDNAHREYYLTDAIHLLRQAGAGVSAYVASDPDEILGANTAAELARVDALLRRRTAEALMAGGVTLYQPDTQAIDPDVSIGVDSIVERGAELRGATRIGRRCHIGPFCILENAILADDVTVRSHSLVLNSRLASGVRVGPFAHLRDGADIRRNARVGNYVEVKKSVVGEGAKAQHLTYLGDATVGRQTNVGAGTITCNYDGVNKNPTRIGDRVFIGSGTELVAPVRVGSGAYVAAGSTITENVPRDALALGRSRQVNKPGWVRTRRQKLAAAKAHKDEPGASVTLASGRSKKAAKPRTRAGKPARRATRKRPKSRRH